MACLLAVLLFGTLSPVVIQRLPSSAVVVGRSHDCGMPAFDYPSGFV